MPWSKAIEEKDNMNQNTENIEGKKIENKDNEWRRLHHQAGNNRFPPGIILCKCCRKLAKAKELNMLTTQKLMTLKLKIMKK